MLLSKANKLFIHHLEGTGKSPETTRSYYMILNILDEHLTMKYNSQAYLENIASEDLENFLIYLRSEGWQPNSLKKCYYTLKSFFGFCFRKKYLLEDITLMMTPIKGEHKERPYLTKSEFEVYINAIYHPIIKTAVLTLFYSGLRIGECIKLKEEDVDFERGIIHVRNAKGKMYRQVPINENLRKHLDEYLKKHRPDSTNGLFFGTKKSGALTRQYVGQVMKDAKQKLKWKKKITPHVIRHSFASNLVNAGAKLTDVQKLMGHRDVRTTSLYTHTKIDALSDTVNLI